MQCVSNIYPRRVYASYCLFGIDTRDANLANRQNERVVAGAPVEIRVNGDDDERADTRPRKSGEFRHENDVSDAGDSRDVKHSLNTRT